MNSQIMNVANGGLQIMDLQIMNLQIMNSQIMNLQIMNLQLVVKMKMKKLIRMVI